MFGIAARLANGQQVAALGIEREEQPIEECQRPSKERGERLITFALWQRLDLRWQLSVPPRVGDEPLGEAGKDLIEDTLLQRLLQLARVALALREQGVEKAPWAFLVLAPPYLRYERRRAEEQPEIGERLRL